jgi:folylpolyglutamate synthase/dihydrofolate synthase
MQTLMSLLTRLTTPAIHLAGTNGKGSVSAILESCLLAGGMSTARYNSPHLVEPRDAISINGTPPSREVYDSAMNRVRNLNDANGVKATTFEIATAAAYLMIQEARVDLMVIECGMGGLRDATNIIPPDLILASGLTSVGLDHTAFLGDTIAKIAEEKSRIVVPGGLLVIAPQKDGIVFETASRVVQEVGARITLSARFSISPGNTAGELSLNPFHPPEPTNCVVNIPVLRNGSRVVEPINVKLNLPGVHQAENLSCALTILSTIRLDERALRIQPKLARLDNSALQHGVERTRWRGRCSWEVLDSGRAILVDGAHNSDSAETLRGYIDCLGLGSGNVTFLLGLSDSPGKSVESVLKPLLRNGDRVGCVSFTTPVEGMPWIKGVDSEVVATKAREIVGSMGTTEVISGLRAGLDWAQEGEEGLIVVCGSLYLVADYYRLKGEMV